MDLHLHDVLVELVLPWHFLEHVDWILVWTFGTMSSNMSSVVAARDTPLRSAQRHPSPQP